MNRETHGHTKRNDAGTSWGGTARGPSALSLFQRYRVGRLSSRGCAMDGPDLVMVALVLAVVCVPMAGVSIYLAVTRRKQLLLTPLMGIRGRCR